MSTGNVAGGHKANLANPRTSTEAKENSRRVLDELEQSGGSDASGDYVPGNEDSREVEEEKNVNNVIGGYKATLNNDNVGEEAKQKARDALNSKGVET